MNIQTFKITFIFSVIFGSLFFFQKNTQKDLKSKNFDQNLLSKNIYEAQELQFFVRDLKKDKNQEQKKEILYDALDILTYVQNFGFSNEDQKLKLQELLFSQGQNIIENIASDLKNIQKSEITTKEEAGNLVKKIDFLSLVSHYSPEAFEHMKTIATRGVLWDSQNNFSDGVQAVITFECFDIFSKLSPKEALLYIDKFHHKYQKPYIDHFIVGRRMAGVSDSFIEKEIEDVLGYKIHI